MLDGKSGLFLSDMSKKLNIENSHEMNILFPTDVLDAILSLSFPIDVLDAILLLSSKQFL